MQIQVVPMEQSHLDRVVELENQCFSMPWTKPMLQDQLASNQTSFLVAQNPQTGELLGYSGLLVVVDEGYIDNIATAPEHRKKGVASALIDVYCRFAEQYLAFLTLEVRASNHVAISLYEKHGFSNVATRPDYYEKPKEDAQIMTRYFSEVIQ
ncbi:MAG: ribosomal protein S18-alanine N-acetyltransferase [Eubacteriales bacterium]